MTLALCVMSAGLVASASHGSGGEPEDQVEASYPSGGLPEYRAATSTSTTPPTPVPTDADPTSSVSGAESGTERAPVTAAGPTAIASTGPTAAPAPTTATATTTIPLPPSTCGPEITKADGSPWTCTFADEFHGTELDRSKWTVHESGVSGFPVGKECRIDSPENIRVSDGTLELFVREEPEPVDCGAGETAYRTRYTGSTVSTSGLFSQTHGRFEVRARVVGATAPGLHSAIWMWPQDFTSLGDYGEIDIAEMYSLHPDRAIPYLHYNGSIVDPHDTNNYCVIGDVADWHDYVLEWTPRHIEIIYDGRTCLLNRWNLLTGLAHSFDQDFFLILTQALGVGGNAFEPDTTPLPASTEIDHVRIWE